MAAAASRARTPGATSWKRTAKVAAVAAGSLAAVVVVVVPAACEKKEKRETERERDGSDPLPAASQSHTSFCAEPTLSFAKCNRYFCSRR